MTEENQQNNQKESNDNLDPMTKVYREWFYQQNQFDSYEKYSLLIKLLHLFTGILVLTLQSVSLSLIVFGLLFWLADAVWKTFQFRIEDRILLLEAAVKSKQNDFITCQFNSEFIKNKPGTIGMFASYGKNALRPTVALPHAVILGWYLVLFVG